MRSLLAALVLHAVINVSAVHGSNYSSTTGVAVAFVIRGPGGGMSGSAAAEGALYTEAQSGNRT